MAAIFVKSVTDPNTVSPGGEMEPSTSPSPTSHFYTSSLPAQPLRNQVGPAGGSGLSCQSGVGARQDLDQITTFSEILDSLKNSPTEKERKEVSSVSRAKDMMYMAPLGPSQVDIGNLSSR